MAELDFLYCASACSMPSSNKRFSRSLVTSGSRSIEECHCWLAPSAPHYSTTRIIPRVAQRDAKIYQRSLVRLLKVIQGHAFRSPSHSRRLELGCLLGAAALLIRLVLQGPHGAQRRLLGLGQTPEARDSEALVGPVATQGAQVFAAVPIPEPDGPIIAATGDSFAIGTDLEGLHLPLMGLSHPQARSALQVPPAQSAITPSTDEPIPDRMPGDCIEHTRKPLQGGQALPTVGIPHEEFPALSATTGGQPPPVGAPDHAPDGPAMSRQPQELRALGGLPHRDVAICPTADQARAIPAPGHAQDPGGVRLSDPTVGASGHIPHAHTLQHGAAGQQLPVWTPGHPEEVGVGVVEVPQDLGTGSCGWVPQPDAPTPPARGEQSSIGTPCHAVHYPCMAAQHTRRLAALHPPEADLGIGTDTRSEEHTSELQSPCNLVC